MKCRVVQLVLVLLKKLVRLGCITQGSLVEITNQRFSLKYQTCHHSPFTADMFINYSLLIINYVSTQH